MKDYDYDRITLQAPLYFLEVLKAAFHSMHVELLLDVLPCQVAFHVLLEQQCGLLLHILEYGRPNPDHHEVLPGPLNLLGRVMPDSRDDTEPGPQLGLPPPALDPDRSFDLSPREHFLSHEDLYGSRVVILEYLLSLFLVEFDAHLVLVVPINIQLLLHICDLVFDLLCLILLAQLPRLVLLLFDRLQGQRVVAERVIYVAEVCHICDEFFPSYLRIEQFGPQLHTLLVICDAHQIFSVTSVLSRIVDI